MPLLSSSCVLEKEKVERYRETRENGAHSFSTGIFFFKRIYD